MVWTCFAYTNATQSPFEFAVSSICQLTNPLKIFVRFSNVNAKKCIEFITLYFIIAWSIQYNSGRQKNMHISIIISCLFTFTRIEFSMENFPSIECTTENGIKHNQSELIRKNGEIASADVVFLAPPLVLPDCAIFVLVSLKNSCFVLILIKTFSSICLLLSINERNKSDLCRFK